MPIAQVDNVASLHFYSFLSSGLVILLWPGWVHCRDFSPRMQNFVTDCITEFRSSHKKNGTFSSPNYPHSYTPDTVCKYVFRGHGKERVQIIFTALDLSYPEGDPQDPYDCEGVDSVAADIKINGKPENIGQYCGSRMPPMLMSNDNTMEVVFTSKDKPSSSKGFQAEYRFVTNFGIPVGKQANDMVCGFTFRSKTAPNGTFTSPNFPGLYPRNTECHYLFYGEPKEKIYITFPYFDVEGIPPLCMEETQSDYVEFSNFNRGLQDRKMDRFCGTKEEHQTKTVNSDENFFRVTFKSNGVYDATGFEAFYQFRKYEDPFSPRRAGGSSCIPRLHGALVLLVALSWLS